MESIWQDLRLALRTMVRQPGFSAVALLTLALGIGANVAIFSVVDAVLLEPLPYAEPERLVMAWNSRPDQERATVAPADFLDWREQTTRFEGLAAFAGVQFNMAGEGAPELVRGASVSRGFFEVLGVQPLLGHTFGMGEPSARQVVLGHGLWVQRFGGDRNILGREVRLNGTAYEVVGVMPPSFDWPAVTPMNADAAQGPRLWVPAVHRDVPQLGSNAAQDTSTWRDGSYLRVVGRLRPGVTREQASEELAAIARRLEEAFPDTHARLGVRLVPLREQFVGNVRPLLWVMLGAVGFVLAIACTNVASLFLARAVSRRREFAVRAALGAGRGRLVRQVLTESLVLGAVAGVLGVLLAAWGVDGLVALSPANLPRLGAVEVDGRVLAFAACISLLTGVFFGLLPALQVSGVRLAGVLKQGGGAVTAGAGRLRGGLVAAEVALAVVLLIGAGLLLRSFLELHAVEPGFRPEGVLTWRVSLSPTEYVGDERKAAFFSQLLEQVRALPGVTSAGAVLSLPLGGDDIRMGLGIEGRPPPDPAERRSPGFQLVSPGYLATLGIPLRGGRDFTSLDTAATEKVVLLNAEAARQYWPGENPVGQRVRVGSEDGPWRTVVGVVGDVHQGGPSAGVRPEVYIPFTQWTFSFMSFALRTEGDPAALVPMVRAAVQRLDADQPLSDVHTLEAVVHEALARPRFLSLLVGLFASAALLLAAVGLSGVIAYTVRQRTRELGIRLALGARPGDVQGLVLGQGLVLAGVGVVVGLGVAWGLSRWMASLLFEVSTTDPLTFGGLALLVLAVSALATWLPARRAARLDPLIALRGD